MRKTDNSQIIRWRYWFIIFLFLCAFSLIVWRMVFLTVTDRDFLQSQGDARTIRTIETPAFRGMIKDRRGEPLAISTPIEAIWVNPKDFNGTDEAIESLANILQLDAKSIKAKLASNSKKEFLYLKRQVTPDVVQKVLDLKLAGISAKKEFKRYYPDAEVLAQLVGYTNIDDNGQEGLELEFNEWLQGQPGKKRVLKDRLGHIVSEINTIRPAEPGHDLTLTIDKRIQYLAYRELKSAMKKFDAKSASIVVMDAKNGEVLAVANQPSFNPNARDKSSFDAHRNRAMTDIFEPGSALKTISVINALESKKFTPSTVIDTSPGWLRIDGNLVKETNWHNYGKIDVTTILQRSSNVGVTKLTLALPPESLVNLLKSFGFGEKTGIEFPGEVAGSLPSPHVWQAFPLSVLSFGYGLSLSNLQLTSAYATIANHGQKFNPTLLLNANEKKTPKEIISPEIADSMLLMLEKVVERGGTATRADVPGYRVAGKTGTVRIVGPNGYEKDHHSAIFVGIVPVSDPRLVISVIVNDPLGKKYYGGQVAAPVFRKVAAGAARVLKIPQDDLDSIR